MTEIEIIIFPVFPDAMTLLFDEQMTEIGATNVPVVSYAMTFLLCEK